MSCTNKTKFCVLWRYGQFTRTRNTLQTRMHSSRMRTARLLPVSPSMHCSWVVYLPGGCTWWECVPAGGVYLSGGVYLPGGVHTQEVYLPRVCTCQGVYLPGGYLPRYIVHSRTIGVCLLSLEGVITDTLCSKSEN